MSGGQGFARRVTQENLALVAPLLSRSREAAGRAGSDSTDEDQANTTPPDAAAEQAEALFAGTRLLVRLPY